MQWHESLKDAFAAADEAEKLRLTYLWAPG